MSLPWKKSKTDHIDDQRADERQTVLFTGRVILNDACSYPCVIHNTAPGGAMIELDAAAYIPPSFRLEFVDQGITMECRRAWHKSNRLGAQFRRKLLMTLLPAKPVASATEEATCPDEKGPAKPTPVGLAAITLDGKAAS